MFECRESEFGPRVVASPAGAVSLRAAARKFLQCLTWSLRMPALSLRALWFANKTNIPRARELTP